MAKRTPKIAPPEIRPEEVMRWLARSLRKSTEPGSEGKFVEVKQTDAPSDEAWNALQALQQDERARRSFWQEYFRMPRKEKSDPAAQAKQDDRRRVFALFEALERDRPQHFEQVESDHARHRDPGPAQTSLEKAKATEAAENAADRTEGGNAGSAAVRSSRVRPVRVARDAGAGSVGGIDINAAASALEAEIL